MLEEIIKYLRLNIYDWIAVLIALLSLIIALSSFYVAFKTLKSQRQTEINTLPIINNDIQEFLLGDLITKLLDGHLRLTAMWYILNETNFKKYPSEHFLRLITIPQDNIYIELFYDNYHRYRTIQGLIELINEYNSIVEVLEEHLKRKSIEADIIYIEYYNLLNCNDRIALVWRKVMTILYNYSNTKICSLFSEFIKDIQPKDDEIINYYKDEEVYSNFFDNETEQKRMLVFMDRKTNNYKDEFSNFLIKRS